MAAQDNGRRPACARQPNVLAARWWNAAGGVLAAMRWRHGQLVAQPPSSSPRMAACVRSARGPGLGGASLAGTRFRSTVLANGPGRAWSGSPGSLRLGDKPDSVTAIPSLPALKLRCVSDDDSSPLLCPRYCLSTQPLLLPCPLSRPACPVRCVSPVICIRV
jgi:hypothetical protein